MARPQKETVDYFPHDATASDGTTLTIIQSKFGNDGYTFWFKLLERLCLTRGHFIDCRNLSRWQFLLAKTNVSEDIGCSILDQLAELDAIDKELWANKIIWSQNLVNNIAPVYKNRRCPTPQKPSSNNQKPSDAEQKLNGADISTPDNPSPDGVSTGKSTQSKLDYSKVKDTIVITDGNIYKIFEDEIGTLTPMIAEQLKDWEAEYSQDDIVAAIKEAVRANVRKIAYIGKILENWKENGTHWPITKSLFCVRAIFATNL